MKTFKIYTSGNMLKIDYSVDAVLVKTYTAFRGTSQLSAFATSKGSNIYFHNIHSTDSVIGSAIDFDAVDVEFLDATGTAYVTITDVLAGVDSLSGNFNLGEGSPLTSDELAAIHGANALSAINPVATIEDIPNPTTNTINKTSIPAVSNVNLVTGNVVVNKGITADIGTYAANTSYNSLVIPASKNTFYNIAGFTKSVGSRIGFYRQTTPGVFDIVPTSENYSFGFLGITGFIINQANLPATLNNVNVKTPNIDNLFLIINTRFTTNNTESTLVIKQLPLTYDIENVAMTKITAIDSVTYQSASNYFKENQASFDIASKKALANNSSKTVSVKNLYDSANDFIGWGNLYNVYTGLSGTRIHDSVAIEVAANSFVTISGDTVATLTPTGAQSYCFSRIVGGVYTPIPDAELTSFYNLNRATTDKAWLKNVKSESTTLKAPNVTGTIYLIINTRYQDTIATTIFSNKDTLQVEVGKIATQYEKRNSIVLNNIEGLQQAKPFVKANRWNGAWGMFFGDSVTEGQTGSKNRMVGLVASAIGLSRYTNYASSGSDTTRLFQIVSGAYTTPFNVVPDYLSYEVLVIMIGHNPDTTVGTIADCEGSSQPNTFYGNISKSIDFILNINPNIKIYLSNVHYTNRQSGTNSKLVDTRISEICEFYSLSKIDVFRNCGINKKNLATYTLDNTHPNPNGEVLLASAIELGLTKGY